MTHAPAAAAGHAALDVLLVHGGWLDGSSWNGVLDILHADGVPARAVQLPNSSFEDDVAAVRRTLEHWGRDVLLIGHSYGGAVATAAGTHPLVRALGYVSASAPGDGEPIVAALDAEPSGAPITLPLAEDAYLWADATMMATLSSVLPQGQRDRLIAVQRPFHCGIFATSIEQAAWKTKPSWYLVAAQDALLPPQVQKAIAMRIGAVVRVDDLDHLSPLTAPREVASFVGWAHREALAAVHAK